MISKQLAAILKRAQELRESSYDQRGADKASASHNPPIDFNEFYGKSLKEAAAEACSEAGDPEMEDIVYYLLRSYWNDVQVWIEQVQAE